MAGTVLPLCLLLTAALRGGLTQAVGPAAHPGLPLLQLQQLEEQFRWLQEVTLSHLQRIAGNYNIFYNIDGRFRALAEEAEVAATARAALSAKLARLATTSWRLHCRLKGTVGALSLLHRPLTHPLHAPVEAGTELHGLLDAAQSRGSQLGQEPQGQVALSSPSPWHLKARWRQQQWEKGHPLPADAGPGGVPGEDVEPPRDTAPEAQAVAPALPTMTRVPQEQLPAPQQPGEHRYGPLTLVPTLPACHASAILLFPNTSAEHVAVLGPGPHWRLQALLLCAWLATAASHLGALLSYATEDDGSKLAMRGHAGDLPGSAHFVIGDREFRELPVMPLLDGRWHHLCITWSSDQGQYRFYVARLLLAAGSGFQQGYEIPAGGSLLLGREQDRPGGGFGTTEAFVGHLAGLGLWSWALLPGEVASMATGWGLAHSRLLTLADASLQGGVRRVVCPCLQHCL